MPIYLKLGSVIGESKAKGHLGWIELGSASFGIERAETVNSSNGGSRTTSQTSELICIRQLDSTSPTLFRMAIGEESLQPATIDFAHLDGRVYLQMRLEDVLVSGYSTGSTSESFSLSYAKMQVQYFTADLPTGFVELVHKVLTYVQP